MGQAGVVVVGAVNVDLVVSALRLPGPGETVVGGDLARFGGGKGANAAVAAARGGARVELVGAVGDDAEGAGAREELRAEGVGTDAVATLPGRPTGVALIVTDAAGENQIAVGAGANAAVRADAVRAAVGASAAGCVLVSTEIPDAAVIAAVWAAGTAGMWCVLDPAPVTDAVLAVLDDGPVLTPNRSELAELCRRAGLGGHPDGRSGPAGSPDAACGADPAAAPRPAVDGSSDPGADPDAGGPADEVRAHALALAARTGAPVVVTLGGDGVLLAGPDGAARTIPAAPARVRDTTGAGDTFSGVLAAGLAAGREIADAAVTAVLAASLSVAGEGARAGMPDVAAIRAAERATG